MSFAKAQLRGQLLKIDWNGKIRNPRTILDNGETKFVSYQDWTSGFFPGCIWYMYEMTGDKFWKDNAEKLTKSLEAAKDITWHHDVGFIINCSYGNAYRLTQNPKFKKVIIDAANSLCTRYSSEVGAIQSWNVDRGWQAEQGWDYPVIIDNMMNLELLFYATRLSNDSSYYKVAINHANTTLKNHFRSDFSSFHVIDYDKSTGKVRHKHTAQGYAHESAWARGQAWGLYGYTMCYRETGDGNYLKQAEAIANFILGHRNLPKDRIPYWDFDAKGKYATLRDASSAAIVCSALYELSTFSENGDYFRKMADQILLSLSSAKYRAPLGENNNFLLMHSVGSMPRKKEIDKPINYADYYLLEALYRKSNIQDEAYKMN
ncbi:MAG: glycoside hydrolase family 88 protein [Carboxylicivirga sp.]|nr:glycoside hydrolase family 88 protein [Carboxylicivirga sp.]MCT4646149.1 glycoside hydrolase family 88 protein [Carboxylicivirga sp.]